MFRKLGRWGLLVGVLCALLVVLAGTLSVTHGHEDANVSHADCSLCATAHAPVQLAISSALIPVAQVFTRVEVSLPPARARHLTRSALFTRPPPVDAPSPL